MMRAFRPGWKMSLFTLLFCPVLIQMGLWQLDREEEKRQLQRLYDERAAALPIDIAEVDWQSDELSYLAISARGSFDTERSFLLDNRINNSRVGYELLTPFFTEAGELLIVNRGWLAQGQTRADLPEIPSVNDSIKIEA